MKKFMNMHSPRFYKVIALVLLGVLFSCKGNMTKDKQNLTIENVVNEKLSFKVLLKDEIGNFEQANQTLITSQEELKIVYASINEGRSPGYNVPTIDFEKKQVALVTMGTKTSGGYEIAPASVLYVDGKTVVGLKTKRPSGMSTAVMTSPFVLFSFEKRSGPVTFEFVD